MNFEYDCWNENGFGFGIDIGFGWYASRYEYLFFYDSLII